MEAQAEKNLKKNSRGGKGKSQNAGMNKKKKKKERRMKLSNYEKAVRKFNLNQQLCSQSKIENRRITRGPLKVKPTRDGMFLKAKRSSFVQKNMLNDANEARKNEDINKIIDIGNEVYTNDLDDDKDILECLNLSQIYPEGQKPRDRDKLNLTECDVLCSQNHNDTEDSRGYYDRNRSQEEVVVTSTKSSSSSFPDSKPRKSTGINREKIASNMNSVSPSGNITSTSRNISGHRVKSISPFNIQPEDELFQRIINSDSGIYDELIKTEASNSTSLTFPSASSRMSKPRKATGEKLKIDLDDFEEFTMKFETALAEDEYLKMNGPGIGETVLRSLKMLYRRRLKIYEDRKMRKGAHHVQEDELESKKTSDPTLTWFFDSASRSKSEDSPRISLTTGAWNAKSDSNIFTFPYSERVEEMRKSNALPDFIQPVDVLRDRKEEYLENAFPDIDPISSEEL